MKELLKNNDDVMRTERELFWEILKKEYEIDIYDNKEDVSERCIMFAIEQNDEYSIYDAIEYYITNYATIYVIRDSECGNSITDTTTLSSALEIVKEYIESDKLEDMYIPDFYEIAVKKDGETIKIYDEFGLEK